MTQDTLEIYHFKGRLTGQKLLILGAIHGDEACGPIAIHKTIEQFQSGALNLLKGAVTFVPVCNPQAYKENLRFIDRNLNRYMSPIPNPVHYEDHLTNQLCPLLEHADILLDLHSYHRGGVPFVFIERPDGKEVPMAKSLGAEHLVYGFAGTYSDEKESLGTTEYTRLFGGYGVTLECGGHTESHSPIIAYQAILNTLISLEMIEGNLDKCSSSKIIKATHVYKKEKEGAFVKEWKNFDPLSAGETIATYEDGERLTAHENGYIILPRTHLPLGEEWFYLGMDAYRQGSTCHALCACR